MKRIIKEIDRKIRSLVCTETHERFDGNHAEADRLCEIIKDLVKIKDMVKEMDQ